MQERLEVQERDGDFGISDVERGGEFVRGECNNVLEDEWDDPFVCDSGRGLEDCQLVRWQKGGGRGSD